MLYQLAKKQEDFFRLAEAMESGSLVAVSQLEPTLWSFVSNIPQALSLTFFKTFYMGNQFSIYFDGCW